MQVFNYIRRLRKRNGVRKMYYGWLILAVFCFLYYMICGLHAGFGSSFIFIWLAGGLFSSAVFLLRKAHTAGYLKVPAWLHGGFLFIAAVFFISFILIEGKIIWEMTRTPDNDCKTVLVLGCRVRGDVVSKSLKARLEAAYAYLQENESAVVIVSGGQGKGENLSEALAMYNYLVEKGVPKNRIIMEDKSTSTDENIRFSLQYIQDKQDKIAIVTNNFHLYRAGKLMEKYGFTQVSKISAPTDSILFLNYMVREYFGVLATIWL